jgi:hypothetical protein
VEWGNFRRRSQQAAPPLHNLRLGLRNQTYLTANAARIGVVGHERHQRNLPGPLDGGSQGTLMFGADTGSTAGLNLGPFGNKPANFINLFVVNMRDVFCAKGTDLTTTYKPASGATTGSSASAAWSSSASAESLWRSAWSSRGFSGHSSSSPFDLTTVLN